MVRARPQQIPFPLVHTSKATTGETDSPVLGPKFWIHHRPSRVSALFKLCGPTEMSSSLDTSALLPRLPLRPMAK